MLGKLPRFISCTLLFLCTIYAIYEYIRMLFHITCVCSRKLQNFILYPLNCFIKCTTYRDLSCYTWNERKIVFSFLLWINVKKFLLTLVYLVAYNQDKLCTQDSCSDHLLVSFYLCICCKLSRRTIGINQEQQKKTKKHKNHHLVHFSCTLY